MILCLDCGNSRLKWGLRSGDEWRASDVLALDDIAQLPQQLPGDCIPQHAIGCNVAGPERAQQIEAALSLPVTWISAAAEQCGVVNGYSDPASLGADRWAGLIGARALHSGAALVVLAGTATTIDLLGADGRFHGGLILPGVTMMTNALTNNTAGLPLARGEYSRIPASTQDAMASGAIHATLGAIQRMFDALPAGPGQGQTLCLLAGGAADGLLPHLDLPCRYVPALVLEGLAKLAAATAFQTA